MKPRRFKVENGQALRRITFQSGSGGREGAGKSIEVARWVMHAQTRIHNVMVQGDRERKHFHLREGPACGRLGKAPVRS